MRASTTTALLALLLLVPACEVGGASDPSADDTVGDADGGGTAPDAGPGAPDAAPDPGDGVTWFTWPAQQPALGEAAWGAQLTDIARHLPASYGTQYWDDDPATAGHETSHGIHAHLRNYEYDGAGRANAFYVLDDRAAFVREPGIRKADVAAAVPASLRGPRYDLYLAGQVAWDDTPLYVFDEWNAYVNGAAVAVGLEADGLWTRGWRDAVMGPLEFTVYAIATVKAVADGDPAYFAADTQLRAFTAWNIRRAMALFEQGRAMADFAWQTQDDYAAALRTGTGAGVEALRQFARDTWGPTWCAEVLGF
ncbi:MAG: hypothetical protein H6708_07710 [Kofleriaceae bacterium]|nr:hypothetical protein [Kofleriaceae bacterium]